MLKGMFKGDKKGEAWKKFGKELGTHLLKGVANELKKVVEKSVVIHVLRDLDLELPGRVLARDARKRHREDHCRHYCKEHAGCQHVAHSGCKAHCHGYEDGRDVASLSRCRAEAHQAEGSRYRHACSDVAVDKHDHELHRQRKQSQRERETRSASVPEAEDCGCKEPKDHRYCRADQK